MTGTDAQLLGPELKLEPAGGSPDAGGSQRIAAFRRAAAESVFIWPMLLLVGGLMMVPTGIAIYRSFFDWNPGYDSPFVGFGNYRYLFESDVFREIAVNQLIFVLGVPLWAGVPLLVALLLYERVPAAGVFRTIFFFPAVLSPVILGLLFRSFLRADGVLNVTLEDLGLGSLARPWVDDPSYVKPVLILVAVWYTMGLGVIFYSAALSTVQTELLEAAELDGANWFERLWHILVPRIMPIFLLNIIFSVATAFLLFPYAFVLTRGGPGYASTSIDYDIYQNALQSGFYGIASAEAVLLLVVMAIVLVAAFLVGRRVWVQ
jgi:ABC-type sugar transport system permease subunit